MEQKGALQSNLASIIHIFFEIVYRLLKKS